MCREQCSEVNCSKEASDLENNLKAMEYDLGLSYNLQKDKFIRIVK